MYDGAGQARRNRASASELETRSGTGPNRTTQPLMGHKRNNPKGALCRPVKRERGRSSTPSGVTDSARHRKQLGWRRMPEDLTSRTKQHCNVKNRKTPREHRCSSLRPPRTTSKAKPTSPLKVYQVCPKHNSPVARGPFGGDTAQANPKRLPRSPPAPGYLAQSGHPLLIACFPELVPQPFVAAV